MRSGMPRVALHCRNLWRFRQPGCASFTSPCLVLPVDSRLPASHGYQSYDNGMTLSAAIFHAYRNQKMRIGTSPGTPFVLSRSRIHNQWYNCMSETTPPSEVRCPCGLSFRRPPCPIICVAL
ncbi:hypothetical protein FIBSPDRAFT_566797 [Athelia psychrophila]|uniref:Uncharacterized protein n=1 Tax=Athelia psychrophila TaxID=1759441 RepID=A0A166HZF6_9AGAM|nr:hypothetical protein FIBSPDRAFT_566797 [Fibularhizoctonia sp. CBS 109695]